VNRDLLKWGALAAALATMASAEYDLARACGFGELVAAGVPAALDIYTLRALRAHREVLVTVVAAILVNAVSHLVALALLPVTWPVVVAVSAIAPLVLWRVHALGGPAAAAPVKAVAGTPVPAVSAERVHPDTPPVPAAPTVPILGSFVPLAELGLGHGLPGAYPAAEQPEHGDVSDALPGTDTGADTGADTWELPDGYERAEDELTGRARHDFAGLIEDGRIPSIRTLRDTYSIGQPRAQRIRDALQPAA
jgi:hypothetical protein